MKHTLKQQTQKQQNYIIIDKRMYMIGSQSRNPLQKRISIVVIFYFVRYNTPLSRVLGANFPNTKNKEKISGKNLLSRSFS